METPKTDHALPTELLLQTLEEPTAPQVCRVHRRKSIQDHRWQRHVLRTNGIAAPPVELSRPVLISDEPVQKHRTAGLRVTLNVPDQLAPQPQTLDTGVHRELLNLHTLPTKCPQPIHSLVTSLDLRNEIVDICPRRSRMHRSYQLIAEVHTTPNIDAPLSEKTTSTNSRGGRPMHQISIDTINHSTEKNRSGLHLAADDQIRDRAEVRAHQLLPNHPAHPCIDHVRIRPVWQNRRPEPSTISATATRGTWPSPVAPAQPRCGHPSITARPTTNTIEHASGHATARNAQSPFPAGAVTRRP